MIVSETIAGLNEQHGRLRGLIRVFDDGIWWNSDALARLDAARIQAQVVRIGQALDEIERLATEMGRPRTELPT